MQFTKERYLRPDSVIDSRARRSKNRYTPRCEHCSKVRLRKLLIFYDERTKKVLNEKKLDIVHLKKELILDEIRSFIKDLKTFGERYYTAMNLVMKNEKELFSKEKIDKEVNRLYLSNKLDDMCCRVIGMDTDTIFVTTENPRSMASGTTIKVFPFQKNNVKKNVSFDLNSLYPTFRSFQNKKTPKINDPVYIQMVGSPRSPRSGKSTYMRTLAKVLGDQREKYDNISNEKRERLRKLRGYVILKFLKKFLMENGIELKRYEMIALLDRICEMFHIRKDNELAIHLIGQILGIKKTDEITEKATRHLVKGKWKRKVESEK